MDNGLDSPKAKTKVQPQGYKFTLETKAWNTVAEHLLQQAPDAQEPELLRIVADALREGAQSPAAYNNVKTAVPFLAKANAQVQTLAMKMPTEQTLLHNETLSIAACLIVMIRENTLIDKLEPRPAQAALLRYFHQSGHWQSNDGSVTSVYYYEIIPKMAEQQAK